MDPLEEPLAKKSKRQKIFQHKWFDVHPDWRSWVKECPSEPSKFLCTTCNSKLNCGLTEILRHSKSRPHLTNVRGLRLGRVYTHVVVPPSSSQESTSMSSSTDELKFTDKVKAAEIRFATFLAENNIPLAVAPQILNLFKTIGKEPAVLQAMKMGKTKATEVINKVVSVHESQRIVDVVQSTKFSVFISETSDITNEKWMTMMVRYVHPDTLSVKTELLQLIHVNGTDCSVKTLFNEFCNALEKKGIPLSQIISFAGGSKNSFKTLVAKSLPHLLTLPCICHSLALVAKKACSVIPEEIHRFIAGIPTFINGSPKRAALNRDFQLSFAPSKWLSRQIAITRILSNWNSIHSFLIDQCSEKSATADDLLDIMNKPTTKAYLFFLKFALEPFNRINAHFQGSDTLVHQLQPLSKNLLLEVLQKFIKPALLDPEIFDNEARNIDLELNTNQRPTSDVDVGDSCKTYLTIQQSSGPQDLDIHQFHTNCLKFYIKAAQELRERLPFDDKFFSDLCVFTKEYALLDSDRDLSVLRVKNVCRRLGAPEGELIEEEWRSLYNVDPEVKERWCQLPFDEMWMKICTFTNAIGTLQFPTLRFLLGIIRALPHSNAAIERGFSLIPDIKTRKRNKLSPETLNAICVIRSAAKSRDLSAADIPIDKNYIEMMSSCNLYSRMVNRSKSKKPNVMPYESDDDWEMGAA